MYIAVNWALWELLASWVAYPSVSTVMQVTWVGSPELACGFKAVSWNVMAATIIVVDGLS